VDGNGGVAAFNHAGHNSDIAIIFDSMYDGTSYNSNAGTSSNIYTADHNNFTGPTDGNGTGFTANSSFKFFTAGGHYSASIGHGAGNDYDPIAGAISKITVESMKYFPSNYINYDEYNGLSSINDYGYYYLGSQTVPVTPP